MWNKIFKGIALLALNIVLFVRIYLVSLLLASPLFSLIVVILDKLHRLEYCLLIWLALSTITSIILWIIAVGRTRKSMKRK